MRIVIIANSSMGLYSFRRELIVELSKKNEIFIITPDNGSVADLEGLKCIVKAMDLNRRGVNPLKDISVIIKYRNMIKEISPDLVITYTIKPNIYGGIVARSLKIPYVCNITGLGTAFQRKNILRLLVVSLYKYALKNVHVVFFENQENRDIFINEGIISKEKTCLLMGAGVNLERYQVTEYPQNSTTNFLFMGRVMKEKGIDELFVAVKRLYSEGYKIQLDVLGGYEENYKKIIDDYENEGWLRYHGFQKDVRPFIEKCNCFVLPSWHEGMANTNLESAASGRPVITSNIPGCKEAVIENKTGFLVERRNSEDLYRVMKKFLELEYDDKRKMGLEGRKHMENTFDKKIVVDNTISRLELY